MVQHFYICIRFLQGHATYILLRLWHIFLHHANIFLHCRHILLKMSKTHFLKLVNILEMLHFLNEQNICLNHMNTIYIVHTFFWNTTYFFLNSLYFFRWHNISVRICSGFKFCSHFLNFKKVFVLSNFVPVSTKNMFQKVLAFSKLIVKYSEFRKRAHTL